MIFFQEIDNFFQEMRNVAKWAVSLTATHKPNMQWVNARRYRKGGESGIVHVAKSERKANSVVGFCYMGAE
jgi:hypothetical protein